MPAPRWFERLSQSYEAMGFPVTVQVWDPERRQLKDETIWLADQPAPGSVLRSLDWD